jgi:hypothetical protein
MLRVLVSLWYFWPAAPKGRHPAGQIFDVSSASDYYAALYNWSPGRYSVARPNANHQEIVRL